MNKFFIFKAQEKETSKQTLVSANHIIFFCKSGTAGIPQVES